MNMDRMLNLTALTESENNLSARVDMVNGSTNTANDLLNSEIQVDMTQFCAINIATTIVFLSGTVHVKFLLIQKNNLFKKEEFI